MSRGKAANTFKLEFAIADILADRHPMTVRQAYYQLVARMLIPNNQGQYNKIGGIIVNMRKAGTIPWEWIEDRNRRPRTVPSWDDLQEFGKTVCNSYNRNIWQGQQRLVEVWLEKDALSGIFEELLEPYGVTLNVGRGYDGWSSIRGAAERYKAWGGPVTVLYFGDFDPSGEDMFRSLQKRLEYFESSPEMEKCAITFEDIFTYNLPHDFAKKTDKRTKAFIKKHGDNCVEIDALPVDVLQDRIRVNIEQWIDLDAIRKTKAIEKAERIRLVELIRSSGL